MRSEGLYRKPASGVYPPFGAVQAAPMEWSRDRSVAPSTLTSKNGVQGESEGEYAHCVHCGQPLVTPREARSGFCCRGCHAAYHFIGGIGLSHFYEMRERGPEWCALPSQEVRSTFSAFDDEAFARQFVLTLPATAGVEAPCCRITFHLVGLHCAACVWLLEKLPEVIPGVLKCRVSIVRESIVVTYDPTHVQVSAIARTLASLGYTPHPIVDGQSAPKGREDRVFAMRLGVAAFSAMNVMLFFVGRYSGLFSGMEAQYSRYFSWVSFLLAIPTVAFSAVPFYQTSLAGLRMRRLHIDLPITMAVLGSFLASAINTVLGREEIYFDTITMLVFLLLCGRWCQRSAMRRVATASELLYSLAPLEAVKVLDDGSRREVFVESLQVGDVITVGRGERFPSDGEVVVGEGAANIAVLTGESAPVPLHPGSVVWAGAKNLGSELRIRVTAPGALSRLGQILAGTGEVGAGAEKQSRTARFTEKVSAYFVTAIVLISAAVFFYWLREGFWVGWDRMIAVLIVSCPCALGIATPVTVSLARSEAGRRGILLRSGDSLEALARAERVIFDKTGTLTSGRLQVVDTVLESDSWSEVWSAVSQLEQGVEHPIADALLQEAERFFEKESETKGSLNGDMPLVIGERIIGGNGVEAESTTGVVFRLGALRWLEAPLSLQGSAFAERALARGETVIGLMQEGAERTVLALFALGDSLRPEAKGVVQSLVRRGVTVSLLSGDNPQVVRHIATQLGLAPEAAHGELSPEEKERLVLQAGAGTVFIGDGVNDARALQAATVGVGITGGAEVCLKVADVFLTVPDLTLLLLAIDGANRTERLVYRHLAISLVYNVTAATLAVLGFIGPLAAALVMPASSLSVISSSLAARPFTRRGRWE